MPVSSIRTWYVPGSTTCYDLEQVVSFWPDEPGFVNVAFVSYEIDTRVVVRLPQAAFEAAYQAYLTGIGGATISRYLSTEAGEPLLTEDSNYIIV
jgi:hypothetical protein